MRPISKFAFTSRWPATYPDRIQLYSIPTPNGVKISIALEEMDLPYEAHTVNIMKNETWGPEYLSLNPNGKIPSIIDLHGPDANPLALFESGAILLYLAEKSGRLLPSDAARRDEVIQWLFFQNASIGPMFGQVGYFYKFAGKQIEDPRPLQRFVIESKRLLAVLDDRLASRTWIMGEEFTIADISLLGWGRILVTMYEARELLEFDSLNYVPEWLERGFSRPAVQRGLTIPS